MHLLSFFHLRTTMYFFHIVCGFSFATSYLFSRIAIMATFLHLICSNTKWKMYWTKGERRTQFSFCGGSYSVCTFLPTVFLCNICIRFSLMHLFIKTFICISQTNDCDSWLIQWRYGKSSVSNGRSYECCPHYSEGRVSTHKGRTHTFFSSICIFTLVIVCKACLFCLRSPSVPHSNRFSQSPGGYIHLFGLIKTNSIYRNWWSAVTGQMWMGNKIK